MATIPDVGSITVVGSAPEAAPFAGAASASHGAVHHHIASHACVAIGASAVFGGAVIASHGFAQSIPTLAGPPIVIRSTAELPPADGVVIAAHGVKEPDSPGSQSRVVVEPQASAPYPGRVVEAHGVKEPDTPGRPAIVRGPEHPFAGWTWTAHGFEEAVVWPGRPQIVRGESPPHEGTVWSWWKYADPWTPARPAVVRGEDGPLFAGSIAQSRVPELGPRHPVPASIVRAEDFPPFDGLAFSWRQAIVQPGVSPWVRPQLVWVFDPPPYAGEVLRARGFAAAETSTPATTATAPYRLAAGQIRTPGAVAGQTGGQG